MWDFWAMTLEFGLSAEPLNSVEACGFEVLANVCSSFYWSAGWPVGNVIGIEQGAYVYEEQDERFNRTRVIRTSATSRIYHQLFFASVSRYEI